MNAKTEFSIWLVEIPCNHIRNAANFKMEKKKKFESPGTSLLTLSLQTNTDFLWVIPKYGPLSPPLGLARSLGPEVGVAPAWCAGEPSAPAAEVVTSPIQRRLSELLLEMGAFQAHLLSEPRGRVLGVMGVAVSKWYFSSLLFLSLWGKLRASESPVVTLK